MSGVCISYLILQEIPDNNNKTMKGTETKSFTMWPLTRGTEH